MLPVFVYLGLLACPLIGSEGMNVEILSPINSTGAQIGLIFIPDMYMHGEQYKKTAQAIQAAASDLSIWVALTKDYQVTVPMRSKITEAIDKATQSLYMAGMNSKTFVGVAHGYAGFHLREIAAQSQSLKAVIFLGSSLDRDVRPKDYLPPTLTLAAELDGITRLTRIAHEFGKWKNDLKTVFSVMYSHPIIVIERANHRQFASGKMHQAIINKDLEAEITEDEAHRAIGKHVNTFLEGMFSKSIDKKSEAYAELEELFFDSEKKLQSFLDTRDLDRKGDLSQWTILAQERVAEQYADEILITNKILEQGEFYGSVPKVKKEGNKIIVETASLLEDNNENSDIQPKAEGPLEIAMKLHAKDFIWDAIATLGNRTNVGGPGASLKRRVPSCKSLNEFAVDVALMQSSPAAQQRYQTRGRKIILEDDIDYGFYLMWRWSSLEAKEKIDGLYVKARAFTKPQKGEQFCKVLTPFRAMEWITIDSLRKP